MTTNARITGRRTEERKRRHHITKIDYWDVTSWNSRDQETIIEMKKHKIDICETKKKGHQNTVGNYSNA